MTAHSLLYDPDCGFCRFCVNALLRWDRRGRLRTVPLTGPEAERLLPGMSEEERMASWHLVSPAGQVHSAGAAFPELLQLLPGGAPLARLTARFPGATERGYRWVADHRSSFGRVLRSGRAPSDR